MNNASFFPRRVPGSTFYQGCGAGRDGAAFRSVNHVYLITKKESSVLIRDWIISLLSRVIVINRQSLKTPHASPTAFSLGAAGRGSGTSSQRPRTRPGPRNLARVVHSYHVPAIARVKPISLLALSCTSEYGRLCGIRSGGRH